jgi:hypothetical protein
MIGRIFAATAAITLVASPAFAAPAAVAPAAASKLSLAGNGVRANTKSRKSSKAGAETIGIVLAVGVGAAAVAGGILSTDDDSPDSN